MEKFNLAIARNSGFHIRMANHQKVKCLGMVQNLEIEVFDVKALVNFHVMLAGLGSIPIIFWRPWLRAMGAIQDWTKGVITLYNKKGDKKRFHMERKNPLQDEDYEDGEEFDSDSTTSSSSSYDYLSSSSSNGDETEVAYLMVDEEDPKEADVDQIEEEEDMQGPYEKIEEFI